MDKEKLKPPFGAIAIQMGFVTHEQVQKALTIQTEEDKTNQEHRLIGRILKDEGYISDDQIYQVLGSMHRDGMKPPNSEK
jgi:hypothetical protein